MPDRFGFLVRMSWMTWMPRFEVVVGREGRAGDLLEVRAELRLEALDALVEVVGRQAAGDDRVGAALGQRGRECLPAILAALFVVGADKGDALRFRRVRIEGDDGDALLLRRDDDGGDGTRIVRRERHAGHALGDEVADDAHLLRLVHLVRAGEQAFRADLLGLLLAALLDARIERHADRLRHHREHLLVGRAAGLDGEREPDGGEAADGEA